MTENLETTVREILGVDLAGDDLLLHVIVHHIDVMQAWRVGDEFVFKCSVQIIGGVDGLRAWITRSGATLEDAAFSALVDARRK